MLECPDHAYKDVLNARDDVMILMYAHHVSESMVVVEAPIRGEK